MTRSVAALILAAGRGQRWQGAQPKVLAPMHGQPLVAIAAEAAVKSGACAVTVIAGDEFPAIESCLSGRPARARLQVVHNPDHRSGIASSIRYGIGLVPADADGCLILLADMPLVQARHLQRLMDAFDASGGSAICVPRYRRRRGNPVLWPSRFFAELMALEGDTGGRQLFRRYARDVGEIEMDDDGILIDIDSQEQFAETARRYMSIAQSAQLRR